MVTPQFQAPISPPKKLKSDINALHHGKQNGKIVIENVRLRNLDIQLKNGNDRLKKLDIVVHTFDDVHKRSDLLLINSNKQ